MLYVYLINLAQAYYLDPSSKLWRKVIDEVAKDYPEVEVNHLLVDACAMHLITNPSQFDVIVTENLFGDILSDEAYQVQNHEWVHKVLGLVR